MVDQYLWGKLQAHRVMDEFMRSQFRQNPDVAPHSTLYLFEPRVKVSALKQNVEAQSNTISQM